MSEHFQDEELYALFSVPDVALEAVRVVRDQKTNIGKGFAFVLFKSKVRVVPSKLVPHSAFQDDAKHTFERGALELRNRKLRLRRVSNRSQQETTKPRRRYNKPATESKVKTRSYEGSRSGQKRRALPQRLTVAGKDAKKGDARKKKRPAVLARKAKQKGLEVPTSSKKNKPGKKT
ncbi:nucleolar protein 12-like [Selaginella moellendorffii]|uniref:nucleolar protein 12-like n=1 Tax=Selaginella moellendorffii TaxID=88036 RepID=UPI000D1C3360|nr:nucleolar protein 12-like [Selaginella moellendorffii]|eukprot:XP_024523495.1 nucleolar protein 12-like [Selaginella moellendorffii]